MPGFLTVLGMSALLGAASFAIGILPLSFAFSDSALAKFSTFGTGLLLGAAFGVIIPEGIETLVAANGSAGVPTSTIALSLLSGFLFMLLVEQVLSPHSHDPPALPASPTHVQKPTALSPESDVQFDVELSELERAEGLELADGSQPSVSSVRRAVRRADPADAASRKRAYPLTLGLVMHALADGLALGSSALSAPAAGPTVDAAAEPSLVVFFALIIHKAPTALALTTSLMATALPRAECRKHLAVFSASTPLGALAVYLLLTFAGAGGDGRVPGVAMLVSGGSFLYVATVLRPAAGGADALRPRVRVLLTALGMLAPFLAGALLGGHAHGGA